MASKAKQVKVPTVYAFVLYGGVIKAGYTYVETSAQHPEAEQDGEILFDSYKKYFGNDLKGRYVKCQKPLEEITNNIAEALSEHKYEESENLYKYNSSDVVTVFKEVTGAKQCSTMGVYQTTEEPKEKPAKKVVESAPEKAAGKTPAKQTKNQVEEEEGEEEQEIQAKPAPKKAAGKTPAKQTKNQVEEEEGEEEQEIQAKPAPKKAAGKTPAKQTKNQVEEEGEEEREIQAKPAPKKPAGKTPAKPTGKTPAKKVTTELDADLEEDVVVQTKGKTQPKGGAKTQIVISDDEQEEEN